MPNKIIEALLSGDLVLFAGAGISTESNLIFKETLYQNVKADLELDDDSDISFPLLMSHFCDSTINGRQKLLEKIKYRFDYCHQFDELYRAASRFHDEIAPLWMLKNIVTTNWDDYFERKCNAIPIVTPKDFAFFNIDQRKVFKIHGSISNYGSLVATKEDYDDCYKQLKSGLIGANLKTLLATKTILFVGYSFRDYDFLKILEFLQKEMKEVLPHIFIVTIDETTTNRIEGIKNTIINTDGRYFFSVLKKHLEEKKIMISERTMEVIYEIEFLRQSAHNLVCDYFEKNKIPTLIYCCFYQDGVQHAIDYLKFNSKSGNSYNPYHLIKHLRTYEKNIRKDLSRVGNYQDIAYVDGYIEGLRIPLSREVLKEEAEDFPLFYIYGKGSTNNIKLFRKTVEKNLVYHKGAEKYGQKYFKDFLRKQSTLIAHHRPFIF